MTRLRTVAALASALLRDEEGVSVTEYALLMGLVSLLGYVIIGRLGAEVETTVDTTRTETRATLYEDENSPFGAKRTQERADAFQARNN